ncbi:MAG: sigma-54 dependent transcriptional regulator [Pseudomonadota bacterium]
MRVLVLEHDSGRAEQLCDRLRYLDYEAVPASVDAVDDSLIKAGWTAALVGELGASEPLRALFQRLSATQRQLPVLYCGSAAADLNLFDVPRPELAWRLDAPVRRRQLKRLLERARRYGRMRRDRRQQITGASGAIREVRTAIEQVADHGTTVLITGESGTGKELVARTIHELSGRAGKPFVPVNCGAIQPELLESELFGHDKGAFTGAVGDRKGRFELADGGTLFLDEIGDMSMAMQVKLLRVLQEQEFTTVGGKRRVRCDCRIVAATHRDLRKRIAEGKFREDLYYRINVFPVFMPALRKRVSDLPSLLEDLVIAQTTGGEPTLRLTDRAMQALADYPWPGNVRELANLVERLAILNPVGTVDLDDLPEKYRAAGAGDGSSVTAGRPSMAEFNDIHRRLGDGVNLKEVLIGVEVRLIREAMREAGGTVAQAARLLQVQRTTLVEKLRKYRLDSDAVSEN